MLVYHFRLILARKNLAKFSHASLLGWQVVVEDRPDIIGRYFFGVLDFEAFPKGARPKIVNACEDTFKRRPPRALFNGVSKYKRVKK